ncbi:hypothetical protein BV372_09370 [Nostoc sp. T09]|uniref:hypothetical protein n=1 Tax=Nostoc sp. T09 TaxID=1932621 RepID=UPI000A3C53BE|nr:hypothetical protein [Nostoc sp. T09]OUL35922.1 hypothetical protein BV372_09370 [Nostoc sp. T09]
MNLDKFKENICKTGFELEFRISETLRNNGWTVINNKYYIDDYEDKVREIDLIAYKASKVQDDFIIYTTLVISCKKSEKNLWALLSKNLDVKDPNLELKPVHIWTNNKVLNFIISHENFKDKYYSYIETKNIKSAIKVPEFHIFAFQEMDIQEAKPKNDSAIYDSITSLMKAQSYEMNSLIERNDKRPNTIYQFNLLSLIDSKLIRIHFEETNINASEIQEDNYIARYIIKKEQTFASIHFIQASAFKEKLNQYDNLHNENCLFFREHYNLFYTDAAINNHKNILFFDVFYYKLKKIILGYFNNKNNSIYFELHDLFFDKVTHVLQVNKHDCSFSYNKNNILEIYLHLPEHIFEKIQNNRKIKLETGKLLKNVYRYTGKFDFTDIPF